MSMQPAPVISVPVEYENSDQRDVYAWVRASYISAPLFRARQHASRRKDGVAQLLRCERLFLGRLDASHAPIGEDSGL